MKNPRGFSDHDSGTYSSGPNSLVTRDLLRNIGTTISDIAERVKRTKVHKQGCSMISTRVQFIHALVEELTELRASNASVDLLEPLKDLQRCVHHAKQAIKICTNAGKVRLFLYGDKICDRLHDVAKEISGALKRLPLTQLGVSDDMCSQVDMMVTQFKSYRYKVSETDEGLMQAVHNALTKPLHPERMAELREDLLERLELTDATLGDEVSDLQAEADRLRKGGGEGLNAAKYMDLISRFLENRPDQEATTPGGSLGSGGVASLSRIASSNGREGSSGGGPSLERNTSFQDGGVNIDESWVIDVDKDVEKQGLLGKGRSGSVYKALWKSGHITVALKELALPSMAPNAKVIEEFKREVSSHMRLHHPNVVRLYGACVAPPRLCMVQELAELGSLHDVIKEPLPWLVRLHFARDMAIGLQFLHARQMLHRDIKSLNMLVFKVGGSAGGGSGMLVKLSDFGLSVTKSEANVGTLQDMSNGVMGTPNWTPPELWEGKPYTRRSEVYSYGVILYELATGRFPFEGRRIDEIIGLALRGEPPAVIPPDTPAGFRHIMQHCIAREPDKRPGLVAILAKLDSMIDEMTGPGPLADSA
eukprot:jgi/Mesvir1/18284/Mv01376-RA.1